MEDREWQALSQRRGGRKGSQRIFLCVSLLTLRPLRSNVSSFGCGCAALCPSVVKKVRPALLTPAGSAHLLAF